LRAPGLFFASLSLATFVATIGPATAEELVSFEIKGSESIPASLTGEPGDPGRGREVAINRRQGNCLACHLLPVEEQPFHGEIGPDLTEVADRLDEGHLRLRVVNPKVVNPETVMPAFYRVDGLHAVGKKFKGKTILTAQQVEDVVAYLMTLKGQ
jgi:sulfur-oxidizing protein SoxX